MREWKYTWYQNLWDFIKTFCGLVLFLKLFRLSMAKFGLFGTLIIAFLSYVLLEEYQRRRGKNSDEDGPYDDF